MNLAEHVRITGDALKNWVIAQVQDSIAVGLLWLIGLYLLKVPWAPLWALLAATLQVIPHLGPVLGLIGPCWLRRCAGRIGSIPCTFSCCMPQSRCLMVSCCSRTS